MAFAAVRAAVKAAFAFGEFLSAVCTLLSSKWMSTSRSLSSRRLTCTDRNPLAELSTNLSINVDTYLCKQLPYE